MKNLLPLLVILTLLGCGEGNAQEFSYENLNFDAKSSVSKAMYKYKNLALYPIYAKEAMKKATKNFSNYVSFDNAIKENKIKVKETSISGTVNNLVIDNNSSDTVFLMAGEVVRGGKQDRTLGEDLVLLPNTKNNDIKAFCVEHGRWTTNSNTEMSANQSTYAFTVKGKTANMKMRKAVDVDKNQSKVWDEVAKTNSNLGLSSSTGAYTAADDDSSYSKNEKEYVDFFKFLKSEKNIVGVVVVTGDKVLGSDIFATESLFKNAFDNLLVSYVNEAISDGKPVNIKDEVVQVYMDKVLKDKASQEKMVKDNGKLFKSGEKNLHLTTY
jgi:hypothetical protein